jgi:molybdopterin-guanine dinucleotide biosynthesis protein A
MPDPSDDNEQHGRLHDDVSVTLAVLAGGEGSRMGAPKAELLITGRPILEILLERFAWRGPTLFVTSPTRERPRGSEAFDREVSDPVAGVGPLRGVLTALENAATPIVLIATVDMPCIGRAQLERALQALNSNEKTIGVMWNRAGADDGRDGIEPFPCALRRDAAREVVARHLGLGRRAVHALASEPSFMLVSPPREWTRDVWTNLNTPQDLARFQTARTCP